MAENLDELRERASLLERITQLEQEDANWTPLEELQERARLLAVIAEAESNG